MTNNEIQIHHNETYSNQTDDKEVCNHDNDGKSYNITGNKVFVPAEDFPIAGTYIICDFVIVNGTSTLQHQAHLKIPVSSYPPPPNPPPNPPNLPGKIALYHLQIKFTYVILIPDGSNIEISSLLPSINNDTFLDLKTKIQNTGSRGLSTQIKFDDIHAKYTLRTVTLNTPILVTINTFSKDYATHIKKNIQYAVDYEENVFQQIYFGDGIIGKLKFSEPPIFQIVSITNIGAPLTPPFLPPPPLPPPSPSPPLPLSPPPQAPSSDDMWTWLIPVIIVVVLLIVICVSTIIYCMIWPKKMLIVSKFPFVTIIPLTHTQQISQQSTRYMGRVNQEVELSNISTNLPTFKKNKDFSHLNRSGRFAHIHPRSS